MKRILIGLSISVCLLHTVSAQAQIVPLPYQDPRLPAEQRADDLLGRLTLEEKVSLMMNGSPAIKRLGIPQFEWWSEALHGIGRNGFATVFPITTAMAASWNDALVYRCFAAASDEARAKNNEAKRRGEIGRYQGLSFWTPNINIFRDPRWGRGQETYGEDPWLTSRMGIAVVRGLQGMQFDGTPCPTAMATSSCWPVPSTSPYTAARSGTATSSTSSSCLSATSGRPTCPPSRPWCRRPTSAR